MKHRGRADLAGWLRIYTVYFPATWLPYLERVPTDMRESFIDQVVGAYLDRHPEDSRGLVRVAMVRLEVEAIKR